MIEFYNVRKKKKVSIAEAEVDKHIYQKQTKTGKESIRYAFKAVDDDGTMTSYQIDGSNPQYGNGRRHQIGMQLTKFMD